MQKQAFKITKQNGKTKKRHFQVNKITKDSNQIKKPCIQTIFVYIIQFYLKY